MRWTKPFELLEQDTKWAGGCHKTWVGGWVGVTKRNSHVCTQRSLAPSALRAFYLLPLRAFHNSLARNAGGFSQQCHVLCRNTTLLLPKPFISLSTLDQSDLLSSAISLFCHCSTLEQARKLDKMLNAKGTQIDAVLDFDVPDSLLVRSSRHRVLVSAFTLFSIQLSFQQKHFLNVTITPTISCPAGMLLHFVNPGPSTPCSNRQMALL